MIFFIKLLKRLLKQTLTLEHVTALRRYFLRVGAGEDEVAEELMVEAMQVASKHLAPEAVNTLYTVGVHKNIAGTGAVLFQGVDELMCRKTIEVAKKLQINNILYPLNKQLKIGCHYGEPPFPMTSVFSGFCLLT